MNSPRQAKKKAGIVAAGSGSVGRVLRSRCCRTFDAGPALGLFCGCSTERSVGEKSCSSEVREMEEMWKRRLHLRISLTFAPILLIHAVEQLMGYGWSFLAAPMQVMMAVLSDVSC
ncbi:hypothetical protein E3N88_34993 [Mikania micrantha]|uniref:Uncharacterized protein n=1 Tax=Mikania micrantha TaxID=192012 RepID=A0A5N6M2I4_9ASTR|nr:hypothetical protein E3N88_34993 [Mikania micrantha]